MIDVTVVVPESRLAEFYENHGKWLQQVKTAQRVPTAIDITNVDVVRETLRICDRWNCFHAFKAKNGRKYCSKECRSRAARERRNRTF